MRTALERVTRARAVLVQEQPFYGCLALWLEIEERPDLTDTMATDGKRLLFNAATVDSWTDAELRGVVAHEVEHVSRAHHVRMGARDAKEWNVACDLAIHTREFLKRFRMPAGILIDHAFDGLSAEEIYSARQQAARQQPKPQPGQGQQQPAQGQGQAQGQQPGDDAGNGTPGAGAPANGAGKPGAHGPGGIIAPEGMSADEKAAQADEWNVRARQAAAVAKAANAGEMPGHAARIIEDISAATVDVNALLADLINSRIVTDYSFARPNRRYLHTGFAFPGQTADALEHLVFIVDTSGSIDNHMIGNAASVILDAHHDGKIARLTVIYADTHVQAVQEFERGDDIKLAPKGGGGTRFDSALRHVEANYSDATAILYLTDLECRHFGEEPECPLYWLTHGDSRKFDTLAARVPFGEPVYIGRLE